MISFDIYLNDLYKNIPVHESLTTLEENNTTKSKFDNKKIQETTNLTRTNLNQN